MPTVVPLEATSTSSFVDEFLGKKPVVIRGLARTMPAFTRWTDAYLGEAFGDVKHLATLTDERRAQIKLADYLRYFSAPETFSSSLGPVYLTDIYLRPPMLSARLDLLEADARCPLPRPGAWAERASIFMGTPGTGAALHKDIFATQSWMAQIRGEKRWRLTSPDVEWTEARKPVDLFEGVESSCTVYDVTLTPGDVLYVPPMWWHQIRNDVANIAVAGHFSSVADARSSLKECESSSDEQYRVGWAMLWRRILELEDGGGRRDA